MSSDSPITFDVPAGVGFLMTPWPPVWPEFLDSPEEVAAFYGPPAYMPPDRPVSYLMFAPFLHGTIVLSHDHMVHMSGELIARAKVDAFLAECITIASSLVGAGVPRIASLQPWDGPIRAMNRTLFRLCVTEGDSSINLATRQNTYVLQMQALMACMSLNVERTIEENFEFETPGSAAPAYRRKTMLNALDGSPFQVEGVRTVDPSFALYDAQQMELYTRLSAQLFTTGLRLFGRRRYIQAMVWTANRANARLLHLPSPPNLIHPDSPDTDAEPQDE